ncbi:hypothetical protein [Acetobacter persici]|uniref:hypothetical protein n=1 Tax=Acetobacter persici TaxID=1076596 RepID=UPI001BACE9ED|nr:hypothetical protein [Acetobacter persici]MBS1015398.1 hypothetical protein [Acetobacter persici]
MITIFNNMYESENGLVFDPDFETLHELFKTHYGIKHIEWKDKIKSEKKIYNPDFSLWSPNTYKDNHRKKDKAIDMSCFVFDIDEGNSSLDVLKTIPFKKIIHRSFNWREDHKKWRLIIDIDQPITFEADREVREVQMLSAFRWWDIYLKDNHGIIIDGQCKDMARQYFVPVYNSRTGTNPEVFFDSKMPVFNIDQLPDYRDLKNKIISDRKLEQEELKKIKKLAPKTQTHYSNFYSNNFITPHLMKKIENYALLPDGTHYTAFYGMITSVRNVHYKKFGRDIDQYTLFNVMCDIDNKCPCGYLSTSGYGSSYIDKKINENYKQHIMI